MLLNPFNGNFEEEEEEEEEEKEIVHLFKLTRLVIPQLIFDDPLFGQTQLALHSAWSRTQTCGASEFA